MDRVRRRLALSRGSSDSGSSGFLATSATSRTMLAACSASTSPPIVVRSEPAPTKTCPPIAAASSASFAADRDPVPSIIRSAVSSASHVSFARWSMRPVRIARETFAFGTSPNGTSVTAMPFGRVNSRFGGIFMSRGGAIGGGVERCAVALPGAASRNAAAATKRFLVRITGLRSRRRPGAGTGRSPLRRAGNHGENRSIRRYQVLLGGSLDSGRCHLGELGLQAVDPRRVVVEQRERRQQIGTAEPTEALHLRIQRGTKLYEGAIECRLIDGPFTQGSDCRVESRHE